MNRRIITFAVAAAVIGGIATAIVPQHAWTIGRVLAAAVVTLTGGAILVAAGAVTSVDPQTTPLDRPSPEPPSPLEPHGLRDARRILGQPAAAGHVPSEVWERLVIATALRLQDAGVDLDNPATRPRAQAMLSVQTWELITTPPRRGTRRDPAQVAAVVNRTLDDLESATRTGSPA